VKHLIEAIVAAAFHDPAFAGRALVAKLCLASTGAINYDHLYDVKMSCDVFTKARIPKLEIADIKRSSKNPRCHPAPRLSDAWSPPASAEVAHDGADDRSFDDLTGREPVRRLCAGRACPGHGSCLIESCDGVML
jgi:hypothetical protein